MREYNRKSTYELLSLVEEGAVNKDVLITSLVFWMSEDDVERFMQVHEIRECAALESEEYI